MGARMVLILFYSGTYLALGPISLQASAHFPS